MYWSQVRVLAGPPNQVKSMLKNYNFLTIKKNYSIIINKMKFKINIKPRISYYVSILVSSVILFYFAYKAIVAYLIHRELYGGGLDTLVLLRASISGIMLLLILLFIQFIKIPDLKSHRTILRGVFIGWTSVFVILIIVNLSSIYFIILTGLVSFFSLITLFSLEDQIKEEKNTLTEKEIYLLQQLAKKK